MNWFSAEYIQHLISTKGYWAVGLIIGLESMGVPLPGETALVLGMPGRITI